ncbi:TPA: DUF2919 family protein [Salmonella enterica]
MKARGMVQHIRRPGKSYRAGDYDDEGNLKAPVWLWAGVAWMLLPWWLTAAGIVTHNTPAVAEALYPTVAVTVINLVAALPAALLCAVYPLRGRYPRVALLTYGAVYLGQTVMLFSTGGVILMQDGWSLADSRLPVRGLCRPAGAVADAAAVDGVRLAGAAVRKAYGAE